MKERPIIFSGPMVRALLDCRKTMTRRVVKPQPEPFWTAAYSDRDEIGEQWWLQVGKERHKHDGLLGRCPYGEVGSRLWVREAWAIRDYHGGSQYIYRQSSPLALNGNGQPLRWRPSIHMPRAASRLTLEITAVRVERVQDITDEDALREGVVADRGQGETWYEGKTRGIFARLWDTIHGDGAWDRNDWVWVIEFKVVA